MVESQWNHLCWHAALLDSLPKTFATMACDSAVAHDPSANTRDSYAVFLTRTGRGSQAVAHFEAYIEYASESVEPDEMHSRSLRAEWVEAIKAGKNPFTPATLKRLRLTM